MPTEKLEPRLVTFIDHERSRATTAGAETSTIEDRPIRVTISHQEYVKATEGGDGAAQLPDLAASILERQQRVLAKLLEIGAGKPMVHTLTNAVTVDATPKQLAAISELDEVKLIRLESMDTVTCMNESVHVIESAEAIADLRVNGRGIRVAILDTGIDKNHPALVGKVVDEISTATEPITVPGLHATHVAGTVASNDMIFRGVAYQADLVNIKVLTAAGSGTPSWVIAGLEQAVRRNALVASLSLGWSEIFHGWICNDADCILCQAADNAVRLGVTVVVAGGNEGTGGARPPFAIRHPGAARKVITVGAVDKAKVLAPFSSTGPGSGRLSPASSIRLSKPDVCAPGVNIVSSVLGGGFGALSGTSMATPHVSGLAALILQQNPNATPTMVKKLLEDTSEPLDNLPNQVGYGVVNAYSLLMRTVAARALAAT